MAMVPAGLFVGQETSRGTEKAVGATQAVHYISNTWKESGGGAQDRNVISSYSDHVAPAPPQGLYWSGELVTELKASATAAAALEVDALLCAAGFEGVASGTPPDTYTYTLTDQLNLPAALKSFTLRQEYEPEGEGIARVAIGCVCGGVTFDMAPDAPIKCTWPWAGQYKRPVDLASLTAGTYNAGTPLNLLTVGTLHSYGAIIRSVQIAVPREIQVRPSQAAATTFRYVWPAVLKAQPVTVKMVIEEVEAGAFAAWEKYEGGTSGTIAITATAGSRAVAFAVAVSTIKSLTPTDGVPNTLDVLVQAGGTAATGSLIITCT